MFAAGELAVYLRSALAALLAVAAAFVVLRRLAGAFETPLPPFPLLAAGVLLAGLARLARAPAPAGRMRAASLLISLAMLVIAASLSLPGSNSVALLGFWAIIVGEGLWAWRGAGSKEQGAGSRRGTRAAGRGAGNAGWHAFGPSMASRHVGSGEQGPADGDSVEEPEPTEPAADVLQQLTLRVTAEGGQELSGWLRIGLAAGQRTGNLHVAFCPSFDQAPQVQVEAVSGPDCRIKAAQVLPYGVRLDVKLDEPAGSAESVLLWFCAESQPA